MEYITSSSADSILKPDIWKHRYDFRSADFPVSGNRKRIRAVTASSDFLWYAACKYLSGYYEID